MFIRTGDSTGIFASEKYYFWKGKLGNIKEVEIRFDRFRTTASGKVHKENPDLPASGALHDLGAHLADQAIQLFGTPEKLFADVFSMKGESMQTIILKFFCTIRIV